MIRRPPRSTRTDTLFPYQTLFRSAVVQRLPEGVSRGRRQCSEPAAVVRHDRIGRAVDEHDRSRLRRRTAEIGRHTSELQSLMRISYAVFCLKKKTTHTTQSKDNSEEVKQRQVTNTYHQQRIH